MDTDPTTRSLRVGDPIRNEARVALLSVAALAIAFEVLAYVSTQIPAVRQQSPWGNDPYDGVVSFTMFFVPLLVVMGVTRSQLCRRYLPLPAVRVIGLIRASDAIAVLVGVTVLVDWIGLLARADHPSWGGRTTILIAALALITVLLGNTIWRSRRVLTSLPKRFDRRAEQSDWMSELLPLADFVAEKYPRLGRPLIPVGKWVDARPLNGRFGIRRRPITCLLVGSISWGVVIIGVQAVREEGFSWLFPLEVIIAAAGSFAFAVLANRSLRVVNVRRAKTSVGRSLWVAATLATLAMALSLAFRDLIWRGIGLGTHVSSLAQLAAVVFVSFAVVLVLSFCTALLIDSRSASAAPSA